MYRQIRRKSKYNNKSREYNGRWYDSKLEASVAADLDWRKKAGEIAEIIPQYKISLDVNGVHIANYFVDFKIVKPDGSVEFLEVKGMVLPIWQMKWKLLEALVDQIEPGAELTVIK